MNIYTFMGLIIIGAISFVLLVAILIFFGRLIKHQIKIWLLRNKGYVQVRHVRDDMSEDYYFIRIRDDHFDVAGGIYLDQKDTKTKSESILAKFDYALVSKKKPEEMDALEKQIKSFFDGIKDNKLMDIKTLSWGIPTITYFGSSPNPVNFKDIKKVYDAKNIAAMIKRILMTKEWKLVRLVLILASIALVGLLILGFLDYKVMADANTNLRVCQSMLNESNTRFYVMFNNTVVPAMNQNSTVII